MQEQETQRRAQRQANGVRQTNGPNAAQKNTALDDGVRYSVRENIVDINGKQYDSVVELDKSVSQGTLADPRRNDL